jgi:hypothetical protein
VGQARDRCGVALAIGPVGREMEMWRLDEPEARIEGFAQRPSSRTRADA